MSQALATTPEPLSPFHDDKLGYAKNFGEKLKSVLTRLSKNETGTVVMLDSKWGSGKTWFVQRFQKYAILDFETVYIDAFSDDHIEEPFLVITSKILGEMHKNDTSFQKIKKSAAEIAGTLLPLTTRYMLNFAATTFIGVNGSNVQEKILASIERATENAEEFLSQEIDEYKKKQISIDIFKENIGKYLQTRKKPLLIIVDELDRCNPKFGVQLLERVKHLFNIRGVVFLLVANRHQFEESIKGQYGQGLDATNYLAKFIDLSFTMPEMEKSNGISEKISFYINSNIEKLFSHLNNDQSTDLINSLYLWSNVFDLELRDIERIFTNLLLAQEHEKNIVLKAYLVCLKFAKPFLYLDIKKGNQQSHKQIYDELMKKSPSIFGMQDNRYVQEIYNAITQMHIDHVNSNFTRFSGSDRDNPLSFLIDYGSHVRLDSVFKSTISKIDS